MSITSRSPLRTTPGAASRLAGVLADIASGPLSDSALRSTTQRLLHGIGVGLASSRLTPYATSRAALADEAGDITVLGSGVTAGAGAAAFINAVASHSSLQEDCGPGGFRDGSHPGVYIIPAALAAAEAIGAPGETLLRGLAVGYEAAHRMGASVPPGLAARRYRPVGVIGPFGAAAAAAAIFGLDQDGIARALAFAANLSAGTSQGFVSGSMEPYFHAGFSARNGLLAAQLARAGAPAAPDALEGPYGFFAVYGGEAGRDDEFDAPHANLAIEGLGSKKYAACLQNQETLELASELRRDLGGLSILRLVLGRPNTPENGTASAGVDSRPPLSTMLQRQMSARYTTASALLDREVRDPLTYETDDQEASDLASRIELVPSANDEISLDATLEDGTRLTVSGRRQSILFPSIDESAALFVDRAALVLGRDRSEAARGAIETLATTPDVRTATALLRPATA